MDESGAASMADQTDLFQRYVVPEIPLLLSVAKSLTEQQADAEDLVQDTLVRAYRAVINFDGEHSRAWLLTILRNAQVSRNRRQRHELLFDPDSRTDYIDDFAQSASAESIVVGNMFDAAIDEALSRLRQPFWIVVQLVDIEGLTYAEAAISLGIPEGTVMSRLHRSRRQMREHLVAAGLAPERGPF